MRGSRVFIMFNIGVLLLATFGCNISSGREPYKLPPVSNFILALNSQDLTQIDNLLSNDAKFIFGEEEFYYDEVRDAILTMRDECEINIDIYSYYGDYIGKRYRFPGTVSMNIPIEINEHSFLTHVVFKINNEGKINIIMSDYLAFKYIFSKESRESILKEIEEGF